MDINALRSLSPLNAINADNLAELAAKSSPESLDKNRIIFRAGDKDAHHVYVLQGEVELSSKEGVGRTIRGGSKEAIYPLAHVKPRTMTALSRSDCTILRLDSDMLDLMLTWDQTGSYQVEEIQDDGSHEGDWMTRLLQTRAFHRIPPANIQTIFMRMEQVRFSAGSSVISQGEDGDYFYIITEGRCLVTRKAEDSDKSIQLAELGPGDSFGEEALLSDEQRNASVTMLTDGALMRLSDKDFNALLNEPMLQRVDYTQAVQKVIADKAQFLDVRLTDEYQQMHIKDSDNIPLIFLRMKASTLNPDKPYIIYCDTGRRSSAAAFLLNERGYDTYLLEGGIHSVPDAALVTGQAS